MTIYIAGNIGRFDPTRESHNVRARPFFKFPPGGGLALFNDAWAWLYFNLACKLPSLAPTLAPGIVCCCVDCLAYK